MLSINKLKKFLLKNNFFIKNYFILKKKYIFLHIVSLINAISFLLYIPSKYKIKIDNNNNNFYVQFIEINNIGEIALDYAGEADNFELEKQYQEINIKSKYKGNIEKYLEYDYNHPISLRDIHKEDIRNLKQILRQLRRLRFCIKNTKYRLAIIYKNYICYISKNDNFECLIIKTETKNTNYRLFVTLDIESFYDNVNSIESDLPIIYDGIYKILDKNQLKNIKDLQNILKDTNDISKFSYTIMNKKIEYENFLKKSNGMLTKIINKEIIIIQKLINTREKYNNEVKSLHKDIEKSHEIDKINKELKEIHKVKEEIINNILLINEKRSNLSLKTDKIYFDNIIMLDAILNNFNVLPGL